MLSCKMQYRQNYAYTTPNFQCIIRMNEMCFVKNGYMSKANLLLSLKASFRLVSSEDS